MYPYILLSDDDYITVFMCMFIHTRPRLAFRVIIRDYNMYTNVYLAIIAIVANKICAIYPVIIPCSLLVLYRSHRFLFFLF